MQTMNVSLECDVMFNDIGDLEVYIYMGDGEESTVFTFNLKDILKSHVEMFTIFDDPPYIRHDDTEAQDSLYTLLDTLQDGAEYINKLQTEYLDNDPDNIK
jgi:hypothetical protein